MEKQFFIIIIIFVLITVCFNGCTQQDSSVDTSDISSSDQYTTQTISPATESIQTILEKTQTIESMSYQINASINMSEFGTQTATIHIWQKTPFLKEIITGLVDGVMTTISVIQRPEGTYLYDEVQKKYILKTTATPLTTPFVSALQYVDSEQIKNFVDNQTSMDFETVTIDGKTATIIQYMSPLWDDLMTIQIWIWNEKGVPLQASIDMTMNENTMTMFLQYSNYSFSDIPDSTFSVS